MISGTNSRLRRIGRRADGFIDYYDTHTDAVIREPPAQYAHGLAGATPTEWRENPTMTIRTYIQRTAADSGWTQLSQWAQAILEESSDA